MSIKNGNETGGFSVGFAPGTWEIFFWFVGVCVEGKEAVGLLEQCLVICSLVFYINTRHISLTVLRAQLFLLSTVFI